MWLFSAQPRTEMPVKQAFRLSKEHKRVSRVQCDAVTATGVGACSSRIMYRGLRAPTQGRPYSPWAGATLAFPGGEGGPLAVDEEVASHAAFWSGITVQG